MLNLKITPVTGNISVHFTLFTLRLSVFEFEVSMRQTDGRTDGRLELNHDVRSRYTEQE